MSSVQQNLMTTAQEKVEEQARVEPAVAQVYETSNTGERIQILYLDDEVVLFRCENGSRDGGNSHRIERRTHFEANVAKGHFEYKPDSKLDMISFNEQEWSQVSYIGEKTSENLHDAGYHTNLDIQQANDDELLEVGGLGAKGLQNLLEFAR